MERIKEGDYVLLYFDNRRKWIIRAIIDKEFHTHKGLISFRDILGLSYGERIKSSLGYDFWLLQPNLCDYFSIFKRLTQIIYPKDAGLIILKLGICPGKKIIEAGTGSGALTALMANLVRPDGHVYTYEMNRKFLTLAKRNIRKANVFDFVTFKNSDARKGFEESNMDAIVIDVADPWKLIQDAHESLKGGCSLASFSPTINQVEKTVIALKENGFLNIESLECFLREMRVEEGKTRPFGRMIAHTGYLTFASKILSSSA